ncbi:hypothetical protein M3Y99_00359300 [Aphelenchoides fujianensis]|nr:hypothetical protein M3Y99_00359300 [Aphelenchoides fujianensis]
MGGRGAGGFSRNVTFFGILIALMVLFSTIYLYISASNDVASLRLELRNQGDYVARLKNELLEINVRLEELKTSESTCKEAKITLDRKVEECSTRKGKADGDLESLKTKNSELSAALESQKANMNAMQSVGVGQEAIVLKLNETIDALRRDLILKDELIRKLETAANQSLPAAVRVDQQAEKPLDKEALALPPPAEAPKTTTKSAAAQHDDLNVLAAPDAAVKPGDRVKIEDANQKKESDGSLLRAAAEEQVEEAAKLGDGDQKPKSLET